MRRRFERAWYQHALAAICLLLVTAPFVAASSASAASAPAALLKTALRDAIARGWVHEVGVSTQGGASSKYIDDIGTGEGRQEIALSNGVHAQVIAFDQKKIMYIRANALGISTFFGISKTQPGQYANKWLIVRPDNTNYTTVAADTTLKSDFESQLTSYGKVSEGGLVTLEGERVRPLTWTIPKSKSYPATSATLYVTASGATLPIELSETSKGGDFVVRWSKWGEAVTLVAPQGAQPMPISPTGQPA